MLTFLKIDGYKFHKTRCCLLMLRINYREIEERLDRLKKQLDEKMNKKSIEIKHQMNTANKYTLFISLGNPSIRAVVIQASEDNYERVWRRIKQAVLRRIKKTNLNPEWIKLDIVTKVKEWDFSNFENYIKKVKRNYFRKGISFDSEFRLAFLEQEINGFALIRQKNNQPQALDEVNINNYIDYKHGDRFPFMKDHYKHKKIYLFDTIAFFNDESGTYELYNGKLTNGIRKVDDIGDELHQLIEKSTYFLVDEIKANGKFEYGYFPCFGRSIQTYNILRHSSTLYAMAEAYEYLQDETIREAIEKGIQYLIKEAIVYHEDRAFVVDHANEKEIKLGSNAHAILALTKLMQVTKDEKYLDLARALGRAIIWMQKDDGGFLHVWEYPSISLKDAFRTVYYDGEAVFALLRLYDIDRQEIWLQKVIHAFEFLIANDYWKYHDHWLSYAANELVTYVPDDKYFIFGLKNCQGKIDFIYHRNTTYPTFLELTMAAFKMVRKIEELGKGYLFDHIDRAFLLETIDRRAEYQRVGFGYPEIVMYFKDPHLVQHGFFIRHQAFRVRIDDIEHNLSGYIHYLMYRVPELKSERNLTIKDI